MGVQTGFKKTVVNRALHLRVSVNRASTVFQDIPCSLKINGHVPFLTKTPGTPSLFSLTKAEYNLR